VQLSHVIIIIIITTTAATTTTIINGLHAGNVSHSGQCTQQTKELLVGQCGKDIVDVLYVFYFLERRNIHVEASNTYGTQ